MVDERWKDVPDTNGAYQVSDAGRIRSFLPYRGQVHIDGRIVNPQRKRTVYYLDVWTAGQPKPRHLVLARLVLELFRGPPPEPRAVAWHRNRKPDDNRIDNLEWISRAEANLRRGPPPPPMKLAPSDVEAILVAAMAGERQVALARRFGVSESSISQILAGHVWADVRPDLPRRSRRLPAPTPPITTQEQP